LHFLDDDLRFFGQPLPSTPPTVLTQPAVIDPPPAELMLLPSGESSLDIAISRGHRDGLFETKHDLIRIIDPWPRYVGDRRYVLPRVRHRV
jgi:hypothetical protein